jgi:predicted protein tyrosine phosphatase
MSQLYVCPLSRLEAIVSASGARSLVTLLSPSAVPNPVGTLAVERHLNLAMHDITEPQEGYVAPSDHHVQGYLNFVRSWDQFTPIVVHCWAGVSRSTAAAYVALCALHPDACEYELAEELRELSPTATPNARFVQLADEILDRKGHMSRAIARIGRGADCSEGTPFHIDISRTRTLRAPALHMPPPLHVSRHAS